jgi:predicted MFS family arabinose efflux permease
VAIGPLTAGSPAGRSALDAIRHPSFRWLALALCLHALASTAVSVHLVSYLIGRGFGSALAAAAAGAVGAAQLLGRLVFAPAGGRFSLHRVTAVSLLVQPLALLVLLLVTGDAGLWLFVLLFGAARGAMTLARPTLVASLYGAGRYGRVSGVLSLCITVTQAAAPAALGAAYDALGAYEPALWALAAVSGIAALAVLRARADGLTR